MTINIDHELLDELSSELMVVLSEHGATYGEGIMALALTLGRLLGPPVISQQDEVKFIQDSLDWGGTYWAEGELN